MVCKRENAKKNETKTIAAEESNQNAEKRNQNENDVGNQSVPKNSSKTEENATEKMTKAVLSLENERMFRQGFEIEMIEYETKSKRLHLHKWHLLCMQYVFKAIVSMPEKDARRLRKGKIGLKYCGVNMNVRFPELQK